MNVWNVKMVYRAVLFAINRGKSSRLLGSKKERLKSQQDTPRIQIPVTKYNLFMSEQLNNKNNFSFNVEWSIVQKHITYVV